MDIKYGITEWGLPGKGRYSVKFTGEAGLDGLQLDFGSYEEGYFMAQRRMMDAYLEDGAKYGVAFPSVVLNDLGFHGFVDGPGSKDYEIAVESLYIGLETAKYMNVGALMVPQFWANEITDDRKLENAAAVLKRLCEKAGEYGIDIMSETTLDAKRQIALMQAVDMPNISTFYDSQNYYFFKGYDQKQTIETLYPYMGRQLHVKDCVGHDYDGGVLSGALLGQGDSDFMATVDHLRKMDYSGWVILENYYYVQPIRDKNEDQYELLAQDLAYLKRVLEG
jgi:sugar phosphate isomerase/epimerase